MINFQICITIEIICQLSQKIGCQVLIIAQIDLVSTKLLAITNKSLVFIIHLHPHFKDNQGNNLKSKQKQEVKGRSLSICQEISIIDRHPRNQNKSRVYLDRIRINTKKLLENLMLLIRIQVLRSSNLSNFFISNKEIREKDRLEIFLISNIIKIRIYGFIYNNIRSFFSLQIQKFKLKNQQTFEMIQNPQIAQSFVLVSILRQQRDRIQKRLSDIPKIQAAISILQKQLEDKRQQQQFQIKQRKEYLKQLFRQHQKRNYDKLQIRRHAEIKISKLRSNMGQLRILRRQLLKQRKQQQQILQQNNQITKRAEQITKIIKKTVEYYKEIVEQKYLYANQIQIGKNRLKQVISYYDQLCTQYNLAAKINNNLSFVVSNQSQKIGQIQLKQQTLSQKLYQIKLEMYSQEQQLQDKKLKINKTKKNIQYLDGQLGPLKKECEQNMSKIQQLEVKLQQKLEQNSRINEEIKIMSADADLKNRDNRLQEHRIQCIRMLIKRLYNCRDRLIIHKRNNNNSPSKSSNKLGTLSRYSQFSIDLSGYREQILKQINNSKKIL